MFLWRPAAPLGNNWRPEGGQWNSAVWAHPKWPEQRRVGALPPSWRSGVVTCARPERRRRASELPLAPSSAPAAPLQWDANGGGARPEDRCVLRVTRARTNPTNWQLLEANVTIGARISVVVVVVVQRRLIALLSSADKLESCWPLQCAVEEASANKATRASASASAPLRCLRTPQVAALCSSLF